MADNVKVEIDLVSGKLSLDCPESSFDSILAHLADFLPKFHDQVQRASRQTAHHTQRVEVEELKSKSEVKSGNGSAEGGAKRRGSAVARSSAPPEARAEVQNLQLNVAESGLLPWGSLGKDWKKYLWILEAARKRDIDGLTNGEVTYLMNKTFREFRQPKVVNNLKKKIKDRCVQPSTVNVDGKVYSIWRILAEGSKEVVQQADVDNA